MTAKQLAALQAHSEKDSGDPRLNAMNVEVVKGLVRKELEVK
jgi:hypothetical protein